jgi:lipid-A-disaccharide synthase
MTLTIGLVAGEASGDNLAAGLMAALKSHPAMSDGVRFLGVGGPAMLAQGLEPLASIDELSVNGFKEPILRLPQLWKLYRRLGTTFEQENVDAFIGIDFNVFNFLLEGRLKDRGIPTAHYVSPSVYAWRRSRTKRVARSADVIFCLFPFEPVFYTGLPVKAIFVGHPLAHEITELDTRADKQEWARVQLGVADSDVILAMLPGSRGSEIELMLEPFLQAAEIIQASFSAQNKAVKVIIPCINLAREEQVRMGMESTPQLDIHIHQGPGRLALLACDAALVKSGTSTLEAMLLKRPMVVSYRLGYWSHWIARLLVKTTYVAMPNILSNKELVPELLQDDAQPEGLAQALLSELANSRSNEQYFEPFANMRKVLEDGEFGLGASKTAAQGIVDLLQEKGRL